VEQAQLRSTFERKAENYTAHIQRELYRSIGVIESIAGLFNSSIYVEREEFSEFVAGPLSQHTEIQALEWLPMVPDDKRAFFEEKARRSGMAGFQFTERLEQGVMTKAKQRARYYPVFYMEPLEGNEAALGYDLGSDPVRLKAILRAVGTGLTTTSLRITLVQETRDQFGFLILRPVYTKGAPVKTPEDREKNLMGLTLGVYRIGDLIDKSLEKTQKEKIGFYLFDDSASLEKEFLYYNSVDSGEAENEPTPGLRNKIQESFHFRTKLDVPGREWSLLFYPNPDYFKEGAGNSWWLLAGGLLFTSLLGGFFLVVTGHTRTMENLMSDLTATNRALEREMVERRKVEESLQASLTEKEILLQEIHHRVKNNLQMVSGLLSLQARHIDNEKARKIYLESENRVMSMALIHENLYSKKDLGRISFPDYIGDLSRNISSTYGQEKRDIKILFDIEQVDLIMDTAIPAGLIINELLTNAYQHAFPGGREGKITIGFSLAAEKEYTLIVKDNGAGMSANQDLSNYKSLGLSLVKTLVELLKGQIEVMHQDGTTFIITFQEYREAGTDLH